MPFKQLFLLFLLIFSVFNSYAQNSPQGEGMIMGRIVNADNNKSIEYATVRLYLEKDSVLITGLYTDKDGKFLFDKLLLDSYYLKFSFTGFMPKNSESILI
jgi:uncharacterized surface anchored protein